MILFQCCFVNQIFCYILIIPGFGIVSTVISAGSNKSVFGYLGMVKSRPTLINNYVKYLLNMLGSSNALNTSKLRFYSKKVKDITMNNQQIALLNYFYYCLFNCFSRHLRDYKGSSISLLRCLRYSPLFCRLFNISPFFNKVLKRKFSQVLYKDNIDPNWVTGFVDAEGCFSVIIEISKDLKRRVRISFQIILHEKDKDILYKIQSFFGVGNVYGSSNKKISLYRVTNITYIKNVIIPHFINYPLISKKGIDFLLWSKVVDMIFNKDHLTDKGFLKILSYYGSINKGVSTKVLNHYPNILPVDKPTINLPENLNPQWVSGFVAGDGGFSIYVRPAVDYVLKEKVYCRFHIAQHVKDLDLMYLLIKFFNCGKISIRSNRLTPRCDYIIQDTKFLLDKIIRHFDLYPLNNLKQKDFFCFKEALLLIKDKKHLTKEGLYKIKSLNLEMNINRLK